jgi:hypothetical protein
MTNPIRNAATTFVIAAALSGVAFGAPDRTSAAQAGTLDTFGSAAPVASHVVYVAPPLYRERTVRTSFRLHRVTCASAALGSSALCYVAG